MDGILVVAVPFALIRREVAEQVSVARMVVVADLPGRQVDVDATFP